METFAIDIQDGQLLFNESGNTILLDTGSPTTFGSNNNFNFMGQRYRTSNGVEQYANLARIHFDILMGMDILQQFYLKIDYPAKEVTFSDEPMQLEGSTGVSLDNQPGRIIMPIEMDGNTLNVAIDTGARISYIKSTFTEGCDEIETREDFYPGLGHFDTSIYEKEIKLGTKTLTVRFGNLPARLEHLLNTLNIDGVVGYDLFTKFTVLFDFPHNTLYL
jgi:hypothetical protein